MAYDLPRWEIIFHWGKYYIYSFPRHLSLKEAAFGRPPLWIPLRIGVWGMNKYNIPPVENNFPPWQIICHFVVTLFASLSFQLPESSGPLPNGKFPGNLPTGRGPDDLARVGKFPGNFLTRSRQKVHILVFGSEVIKN